MQIQERAYCARSVFPLVKKKKKKKKKKASQTLPFKNLVVHQVLLAATWKPEFTFANFYLGDIS